MGILETIQYIYMLEARRIASEKIVFISRLEFLFKCQKLGAATNKVAKVEKVKEDFVVEFNVLMTEKSLKKLKKQVVKFYDGLDVETPKPEKEIQKQLITIFLPYKFSDKALASFFRVRPSTVKKIRAAATKN